ncbi:MAG: F0F1 ATP synthase subunit alpha [Candidatus Dormibacteria bacterium]
MSITSQEITELLKQRIQKFDVPIFSEDVGIITDIGDGIAHVYGLAGVKAGELVEFSNGVKGLALNLESDSVGVIIMGPYDDIEEGSEVRSTGQIAQVPVGPDLVGRVVNALGEPIDGKGPIAAAAQYAVERVAPGVIERKPVFRPMQTGLKAVDAMVAIGRGQRELIIGDRQRGKSAIAIDAVINQKGQDNICVYVCIGQNAQTVARLAATLEEYGAMAHSIIVAATSSEPAALWYLAPYAGCAMAEYFLDQGQDATCVYDDLSKHAWAYRQISLLLRRPPGREAYPGDVFYLHSRLLERACQLSDENGGGSIAALPLIETLEGDVSGYIPTNVISITDGQIFVESDLFNSGIRPAVNAGTSVSRVGGDAQIKAMKQVAGQLRLDLAQYRELAAFAAFSSDLDKTTLGQLQRGQRMTELLKQPQYSPLRVEQQVSILFAGSRGLLDDIPVEKIVEFEKGLHQYMGTQGKDVLDAIAEKKALDDDLEGRLKKAIEDYKRTSGLAVKAEGAVAEAGDDKPKDAPAASSVSASEGEHTAADVAQAEKAGSPDDPGQAEKAGSPADAAPADAARADGAPVEKPEA